MKLPGWTGTPLHALGGGIITATALLVGIPWFVPILVLILGGWIREVLQHDLTLTLHQWIEALAWPVGGVLVVVVLSL